MTAATSGERVTGDQRSKVVVSALSKLLDERIAMFPALADWRRRWNAAYAERFGETDTAMAALLPLDEAAAQYLAKAEGRRSPDTTSQSNGR